MKKATPQLISVAIEIMSKLMDVYRRTGSPVTVRQLSESTVSISYVEQVIGRLRESGVVTSQRGPGGGYVPQSSTVTVGQVVRALKPQGFLNTVPVLLALEAVSISSLSDEVDHG
ncbi:Rrf2 family transcriptional regulator [Lelliottia sp. V106_10]|uniref:RrF2 family transcriptional regulator n=1 Tax=Lelliottia wanjuensis TaxID=3050585 RepID=UPI00254B5A93|nr:MULTISPECIES: Rrf2 family transcriptional regulator [unclassified Lelliottia]MDK9373398.1 Rrf2 family transcriptional regulator [Lelliottia sp. V106_10]MDK9600191.1 Rrf2 family transcriptional regulator [Lelliottia sp. V106_5]